MIAARWRRVNRRLRPRRPRSDAVLLFAVALSTLAAAKPVPVPLVNGGFEEWTALDPGVARQDQVQNVDLDPPGWGPTGWVPLRELGFRGPHSALIARDGQVKHSGDWSVRLRNKDMRDISLLAYSTERFATKPDDPHNIQPNRRYLLRWWVKGEQVAEEGNGPLLMMFIMSHKDGQWTRANTYEQDTPLPKGTFDWQQRRFVFITDAHARWLQFSLQLRWSTGTIWYDDVALDDIGAVVPVETY